MTDLIKIAKNLSLISAIFCLGVALLLFVLTYTFLGSAEKFLGTVTEVARDKSDNGVHYRPIIEYTDNNGTEHTFKSTVGSNPQRYFVGDKVGVLYNANHPLWKEMIDNTLDVWLLPIVFLIIGVVDFGFWIVLFVLFRPAQTNTVNHNV